MTIDYKDIEDAFRKVAPLMIDWNPTDRVYAFVSTDEVPELIHRFPAYQWKENKWECEEIARAFMHDVRRWEAEQDTSEYNRAVGVAFCSKFDGQEVRHTVNVLITPDGPVLADLQTGLYHFAEEGKDEIYFVEM